VRLDYQSLSFEISVNHALFLSDDNMAVYNSIYGDIIRGRLKITGFQNIHGDWRKEKQLQNPVPSISMFLL
jgi:Ca2+/H+ antiporter